jgi:PAS domain S-box-containing protein
MIKLRDVAIGLEPIKEDVIGAVIYERFKTEPDLMLIGVVDDDGVPTGLIERNEFSLRMASTYGRALYAGRPISLVMDNAPLIVDAETLVADFTEDALARRPSDLMKGIIVVSKGRYSGVATITALLKVITDQSCQDARALNTLAEGLYHAKWEALKANTLLREALDAMSEGVAIFDAEDRCVLWNPKYAQSHRESLDILRPGTPFEELLRHGVKYNQYPEAKGRETEWAAARLARRAALVDRISEEQALPDSRFIRLEDSRLPSGGSISVAVDITEIKRREVSFRLLFDDNPVPLVVVDSREMTFMAVNDAAASLYGHARETMQKMSILDILAPEEFDGAREAFRNQIWAVQTAPISLRHLTATGQPLLVRPYIRPFVYQNRAALLVAALDVTAAETAETSLKSALRIAEAANKAKSEFLANMSHEIRTPLNGVLGVMSVLAKTRLTGKQSEMVGIVEASARTLQALLDDLLDIAKIESGLLDLQPQAMLPAAVANQVASLFDAVSNQKKIAFHVEIDEGAYQPILADRIRIAQIMTNLCSNAVKFTESGKVVLAIQSEALENIQRLTLSVTDTGIGISEAGRQRLFERFSQADGSITRRFGGTGLGLAISQELAKMMGGEITVRSVEGQGSTFSVVLDFPRVEIDEAAAQTSGEIEAIAAPDCGIRVLLVEDHPVNRKVVEMIIGDMVDLTIAENGAEAVDAEAAARFDLILMDMQMPVMDGLDAARAIRSREGATGRTPVPIIALTANTMAHQIETYLASGMDGHVAKPIDSGTLFTAIAEAINPSAMADSEAQEMGAA